MHEALARLGVPGDATVLEPGCGIGQFHGPWPRRACASSASSWTRISGRIARALHPDHDIRIENFRDTRLPEGSIDAVIGNVPFADVKLDYRGQKLSLHDFFFAKSLDALKPGGVLALVTSHFTLDKQNAAVREYLADRGRFPRGDPPAVRRLQARRHGASSPTSCSCASVRPASRPATPTRTGCDVAPLAIEGVDVPINRYFLNHPEMVLGTWSRKDTLYGGEGYSVTGNGDLAEQLAGRDPPPAGVRSAAGRSASRNDQPRPSRRRRPSATSPKAASSSATTASSARSIGGQAVPVVYGGTTLKADGTHDRQAAWPP